MAAMKMSDNGREGPCQREAIGDCVHKTNYQVAARPYGLIAAARYARQHGHCTQFKSDALQLLCVKRLTAVTALA
jgi:hypothetical protein